MFELIEYDVSSPMGFRSFVKKTAKTNTNVKGWSGWHAIKANANVVKNMAADFKYDAKPAIDTQMTFEAAIKKYGLSEKDIAHQMKSNLLIAYFAGALSLIGLIWALYLLINAMFFSSLMGFSLSVLMFAYAFRSHFFYYQLKQKRLNCTVKEWASSFLSKK